MVPSSIAPTLNSFREEAAQASGGSSSAIIYSAILRVIQEFEISGTALDFGAGTGSLTRRLRQSGRFNRVVAADLMDAPPDLPSDWIRGDLNESLSIADSSFDCVIAAEVIEHLENPRAVAREIFRLLKPEGCVILSTPNNESWRSILSLTFRGHHVAFLDSSYPAHITALLRADVSRILVEAGFEPPQFRFTNSGSLPGVTRLTWQKISAGLLGGVRFSDNLLVIARKSGASH